MGLEFPELGATETVVATAMLSRSMTETVSSSVLATAARPAMEERPTPCGEVPTLSVPEMLRELVLITETVFDPLLVITARLRARSRAMPRGDVPTAIGCIHVEVSAFAGLVPVGLRTSPR